MINKKTIKFSIVSIIILIVFLIAPQALHAGQLDLGLDYATNIGLGTRDIREIIANVINIALGLLGIIAIVIILYGGFKWMTSGGEAGKIEDARKILINGAIGLGIILSAFALTAFIFRVLLGPPSGFNFSPGNSVSYEGGTGALGGGIIQNHYPARNAVDVSRNTSIVISFKEKIDIDQIIDCGVAPDTNDLNVCTEGKLRDPRNVSTYDNKSRIFSGAITIFSEKVELDSALGYNDGGNWVLTSVGVKTPDNGKTFIFTPSVFLGSADFNSTYTVGISPDLRKETGQSAFGNLAAAGSFAYSWNFEVSTRLDTQPPTVLNVIPIVVQSTDENDIRDAAIPRNMLIQINFSEPINPVTISGEYDAVANSGFDEIQVFSRDASNAITGVSGRFTYSNNYQTVEFVTSEKCGRNSCGGDVFCLPGDSLVDVLVKTATLDPEAIDDLPFAVKITEQGFDGVVDLANNALDGNNDGVADGSGGTLNANDLNSTIGDNYSWQFATSNRIDLSPPSVDAYGPIAGQEEVDPRTTISANYDKLLSSSSIKPDSNYGDGFCNCTVDTDCNPDETCSLLKGYCVDSDKERVACYNYLPSTCNLDRNFDGVNELSIDDVCLQQTFISINQDQALQDNNANPNDATWYLPFPTNNISNDNPALHQSNINIKHGVFLEFGEYGVKYGSGIKDIFQNCYTPNAAPGCVRVPTGIAGVYSDKGTCVDSSDPAHDLSKYDNNRPSCIVNSGTFTSSEWAGETFPSCDLTSASLSTAGVFNISYVDTAGRNRVLPTTMYAWNEPINDIYNGVEVGKKFLDVYKTLLSPNSINFTIYYDQTIESYAFIAVAQKEPLVTTLEERVVVLGQNITSANNGGDIQVSSVEGLPSRGVIFVNNDNISYDGINTGTNSLMNVEDISSDHFEGDVIGDDALTLGSTDGMSNTGVIVIDGDEINYTGIAEDGVTLTGVTGIDLPGTQTYEPGSEVKFKDESIVEFSYGVLDDLGSVVQSPQDLSTSNGTVTAQLLLDETSDNDGLIQYIGKDSTSFDFRVIPAATYQDLQMRFIYAGGVLDLQPGKEFTVIGVE